VVVIIVVIFVVIGAIAAYVALTAPPNVDVTYLNVYAPDNVCGLNTNPVSYFGFNASVGSAQQLELQLENFNSTACTLRGVTTNSSGFSVSSVQVPDTVGGLGNGTLNFTLGLPGGAYTGVVNLVFS